MTGETGSRWLLGRSGARDKNWTRAPVLRFCRLNIGYSFQAMRRTTPTETLALHLMHRLYEATYGRPNPWRMLAGLQFTQPALDLAVERGWLIVDEGGRSVCLTEAGRERVRRWRDEEG